MADLPAAARRYLARMEELAGAPIRYVGVGEKAEDLVRFDPETFIQSLFAG